MKKIKMNWRIFKHSKNKKVFHKKNKKAMELDFLGWMIIAVIALVIGILILIILKGKGAGALGFISDMFRFGGK